MSEIAGIIGAIGGVIGAITGVVGIYLSWFRSARVELKVADSVDVVFGRDGNISDFHLACSFENQGTRTGTVQRMTAKVVNPDNESCGFKWEALVGHKHVEREETYVQREMTYKLKRVPLEGPRAIAVRKSGTEFAYVLFRTPDVGRDFWRAGEYTFEISVWVNAKKPTEDPHTTLSFQAKFTEEQAAKVGTERGDHITESLEITDWNPDS